ncbi:hypothetical protein ACF3MZ_05295 [Paenibacillaceae bacterium WGS1546]|uniref:hypothetical protein n=1 Tax=Cohnella sp. WGS1546 TaxID=3366810 RepID=UPI00372D277A
MEAEALVDEAQRKGSVLRIARVSDEEDDDAMPWHAETATADAWDENFPERMKLVISDKLYIEKDGLTFAQINALIRLAAFQNPDFYKAQKMRLSTFGKPRIINCSAELKAEQSKAVAELLRYDTGILAATTSAATIKSLTTC